MTHGQVGLSVDQYIANADLHVPTGFSKYSSEALVPAPHLNAHVLFFNNGDDVRYLVGAAKQICHWDQGHNAACHFMHRPWDKE